MTGTGQRLVKWTAKLLDTDDNYNDDVVVVDDDDNSGGIHGHCIWESANVFLFVVNEFCSPTIIRTIFPHIHTAIYKWKCSCYWCTVIHQLK